MIRIERAVIRAGDVAVVADVSLHAAPGEAWGLIGPGGCGKGALVAAVAGGEPLAGGDIIVAGRSLRREPDAARLETGYAPTGLEAWPAVRADEFLDLFGIAAGLSGSALDEARARALEIAGLKGGERLDTIPEGAAKRLLLGRAVLHDPAVLALDDPFRGLDPIEQNLCERLIEAAVLVDRTIIAAIDSAIVPTCFTHVALMDSGRIVARGPAHPAAFAPGRTWNWRVTVARNGTAARECLADRVPEAHLVDDLTVDCRIDPALSPPATLVTALVRSGIAVESAGFHPFWSAQLVPSDR
jgi:ABC-2 type transport system ATP-binding protein